MPALGIELRDQCVCRPEADDHDADPHEPVQEILAYRRVYEWIVHLVDGDEHQNERAQAKISRRSRVQDPAGVTTHVSKVTTEEVLALFANITR